MAHFKGESQKPFEGKTPRKGGDFTGERQRTLERGAQRAGRGATNTAAPGYPPLSQGDGDGPAKRGKRGKLYSER